MDSEPRVQELPDSDAEQEPEPEIPKIKPPTFNEVETILDKYRKRMMTGTTIADMKKMLGNATNIIKIEDMTPDKYPTLESILEPYGNCNVLYPNPNDETSGHWCILFETPQGTLQYFDSYGAFPSIPIKEYNEDDIAVRLGNEQPIPQYLIELILKSKYADNKFFWNEIPIQNFEKQTSVCGLYCCIRLRCKHMDEYQFSDQFYKIPLESRIDPDLAISALILYIFPFMEVK